MSDPWQRRGEQVTADADFRLRPPPPRSTGCYSCAQPRALTPAGLPATAAHRT